MARFKDYENFNLALLENIGIPREVINYIRTNEYELLTDNEIGEIYKSYSNCGFTEAAGYNSDETFRNALIEYGQHHHSKGFDILMLAFEGYPLHQIQDLYELTDEEITGEVADKDYENY